MGFLAQQFPGSWRTSSRGYRYYLPANLERSQEIFLVPGFTKQVQDTSLLLGEFSSLIKRIPNPHLFIHAYATKEATLSSCIEGTQTNIEDAFKKESEVAPEKRDDWEEVNAYIQAMKYAMERRTKLPLCNRLIQETHNVLLSQVRGKDKQPGAYRTSQNWIGGSRPDNAHFVPPAHEYIAELMSDLEKFIQTKPRTMPELMDAALIHYQFETIHPFLDGNGRIGRMLISLYLLEKGILEQPILYISTFLEKNRKEYYAALDKARESQDGVAKWVSFFLDAVKQTAQDGIDVTQKLLRYDTELKENVLPQLGRKAGNALRLLEHLYDSPVLTAKNVQKKLNVSPQTSQKMLKAFIEQNILREVTGNKRNRLFIFHHYITLLEGKDKDEQETQ